MVMQCIVHRDQGHTAADVAAPGLKPCGLAVLPAACLLWCRYKLIEEKLQLSEYLQWTFLSCQGPMKVRERGYFTEAVSTAACVVHQSVIVMTVVGGLV